MTQFSRAYRLQVGSTDIDARAGVGAATLRIAFSVERTQARTPNACEVRVWNLNAAHRSALHSASTVSVSLEAGYQDSIGLLFLGDLRSARTHREGPDLITTVSGGDGESAIRTARISKTFAAGTRVSDVLRELARTLGIKTGNVEHVARQLTQRLSRARTLSGRTYDELEAFCRAQGLRWSIQDSALQLRVGDAPVAEQRGPLLTPASGLIGTPEVESATQRRARGSTELTTGTLVTGTTLLRPDLVPGVPFRVESQAFSGNLVCIQTTHRGDTHSSADWVVDFVGRPY